MLQRQQLADYLLQVAAGDRHAFNAVYEATNAKLFGIVFRILRRRDLSEDVLQDVYIRIWQRADSYNPAQASPIAWMAAIARNRAIDEIRKRADLSLDDIPDRADIAGGETDALAQLEFSEAYQKLNNCLEALDDGKREMVVLAYRDGYSREELSVRYGAPVGTIKTWLHRSLKQLKDCMG